MASRQVCLSLGAAVAAVSVLTAGRAGVPLHQPRGGELLRFVELPGVTHTLVAEPFERHFAYGVENLSGASGLSAAKTATISVTYNGFTPQAQAAFQAAVNVWESIVTSSVPIRVNANFISQGPGVLGSAISNGRCANFAGASRANTLYPAALADKLAGSDVCVTGASADITANFNSNLTNWSFDTSGGPIGSSYSFMTVVLHELGHGLGFWGSAFVNSSGVGDWGDWSTFFFYPHVFDALVEDGAGQAMTNTAVYPNPSTALGSLLTSGNLFFDGPETRANNGGAAGKLESSLNPFVSWSSFSHVDDALYTGTPNALMTYALAMDERVFDPGPLVRGMFADMGWTVGCAYSISPTSVPLPLAGGGGTVTVTAGTGCAWTATSNHPSFITVTGGASGSGNGVVTYAVSAAAAPRSGTITIAGQTFTVNQTALPVMTLAPAVITMAAVNNGFGTLLSQTPAQALALAQSGAGTVTWTASSNQSWVTLSGPSGSGPTTSGTGPATIFVSINNTPAVLPSSGTRTATITVAASGAANSPTATVSVRIYQNGTTTPPSGQVDTPAPGAANVTGSIAVTGWGIDDVGVVAAKICRQPVAGESAPPNPNCNNQAQIFIGDGTFINGARPDIAAAFPNSPQKDRAGWGYLLLTNFLPNAGNGTFTLVTWLTSADGQWVQIDARAITCTNATATAPFGAIDTPEQGGVASGAAYANWGWVLAAQPISSGRYIPTDGSTIQVYVDGVLRGTLDSYNNARPDIQALFPGYFNTNGAVGVKMLNTTTLANGVHSIFWIAADNFGAAAGIGSRFFTVSNSVLVAETETAVAQADAPVAPATAGAQGFSPAPALARTPVAQAFRPAFVDAAPTVVDHVDSISSLPHSYSPVAVTHGFDPGVQQELAWPDPQLVRVVRTAQLERILIDLSATGHGDATYRGYSLDGERLRALPVGSSLDATTGHFAWAVGLGFGGAHELLFVRTDAYGSTQVRVRVEIAAR